MPMINFQCIDCGTKFTELVNSRTKALVRCPMCKGEAEQIYEGKCNSLQSFGKSSSAGDTCQSCPM